MEVGHTRGSRGKEVSGGGGGGQGGSRNFFHGLYGGPRANSHHHTPEGRHYKFLKEVGNENLDPEKALLCGREEVVDNKDDEPLDTDLLHGCANLFDQLDKRIQVVLRDGRLIIGVLFSVDQFANLTLHNTFERIVVGDEYGDIPRGLILIRGDSLVLIGEMSDEKEEEMKRVLRKVPVETILIAQKEEQDVKKAKQAKYADALKQRGVCCTRQFEEEF